MIDRRPVRVGVLGYGYWGPNIVRTLHELPETEPALVCDGSPDRLREARERFDVPVSDDWRHMIDDVAIDAVVVATPASTHCELTLACLAAGKHVLVEKPFATNVDDAERMYAAAEERGLTLAAGHIFLYNPSVQLLTREVTSAALGELRTAFAVRASHGPRARNDVDVVFDCMVHDVYVLQRILGPAVEVSANGVRFLNLDVADSASAAISFTGGARAFCYASWCEPVKTRRMTLVGSKAMADYDDLREQPLCVLECGYEPIEGVDSFGNVGLRRYERGRRVLDVPCEEPLALEIASFARRVLGEGDDAVVSPGSVLATLRTVEAIERSMARGGAPEPVGGSR